MTEVLCILHLPLRTLTYTQVLYPTHIQLMPIIMFRYLFTYLIFHTIFILITSLTFYIIIFHEIYCSLLFFFVFVVEIYHIRDNQR